MYMIIIEFIIGYNLIKNAFLLINSSCQLQVARLSQPGKPVTCN